MDDKDFYTVKELVAAEWWPYKQAATFKLIKAGKLEVVRYSARKMVIRHDSITQFLNQKKV